MLQFLSKLTWICLDWYVLRQEMSSDCIGNALLSSAS